MVGAKVVSFLYPGCLSVFNMCEWKQSIVHRGFQVHLDLLEVAVEGVCYPQFRCPVWREVLNNSLEQFP